MRLATCDQGVTQFARFANKIPLNKVRMRSGMRPAARGRLLPLSYAFNSQRSWPLRAASDEILTRRRVLMKSLKSLVPASKAFSRALQFPRLAFSQQRSEGFQLG
jgi:hypothetical protein